MVFLCSLFSVLSIKTRNRYKLKKALCPFVVVFANPALVLYRGADKSLARPGRKQATATEDFDIHISYF